MIYSLVLRPCPVFNVYMLNNGGGGLVSKVTWLKSAYLSKKSRLATRIFTLLVGLFADSYSDDCCLGVHGIDRFTDRLLTHVKWMYPSLTLRVMWLEYQAPHFLTCTSKNWVGPVDGIHVVLMLVLYNRPSGFSSLIFQPWTVCHPENFPVCCLLVE